MTIDQAASSFSFINDFKLHTELVQYGDNALPLYASALYLDLDDFASFASNSLTDDPADKKADIIYISEADGLAYVAQGYSSQQWSQPTAPTNKACDLNTAAAWLLQADISTVPSVIRPQAQMLRKCIADQSIDRIIFAYAHNACISPAVKTELETLQSMVSGLSLCQGLTIETVELGLQSIQELYLNSTGIIQVTEEIDLESDGILSVPGGNWNSFVLTLNGEVLRKLYETHKSALFSANLRDFLGLRKNPRNVNNTIRDTAQQRPDEFFILNNGVTLITNQARLLENPLRLRVSGLSVVNGAQTTGSLFAAGALHASHVSLLARVIRVSDDTLITKIVAGNNTQNSIVAWDRRSNDSLQIRIKGEFAAKAISYVHRRDSNRHTSGSIFAEQIGQMLCAFGGDLQTAIRAKAEIFESDVTYAKVFPNSITIEHMFAVQTLGWAYDDVKSALRAKLNANSATQIEQAQFQLIDFPASKQFVLAVFSHLREEIAGRPISHIPSFRFRQDKVISNPQAATSAWASALSFLLPLMVSTLPAPPYEVVRSNAHLSTVATQVRGLTAGLLALQNPFATIRTFLANP
ncbi:MAG: AIPR family protein [Acidobacteriaceae bacterium]|jgi:hypothetical protein